MSAADVLLAWLATGGDSRYRSATTVRRDGELCIQFKVAIFTHTKHYGRAPRHPDVDVAIYDDSREVMKYSAENMRNLLADVEAKATAKLDEADNAA